MNGRSFRRGVLFVVVAWFDKGRHPIMDRCHKFVGFTSENGEELALICPFSDSSR